MHIRTVFTDYMEAQLKDETDADIMYLYERQLMQKMLDKTESAKKAGLSDEKIIADLVISEFADIKADYKHFRTEELNRRKEKKIMRFMRWGSLALLILMLASYFLLSGLTGRWSETWLIIVGCVTLWTDTVIGLAVKKLISMKKLFFIPARIIAGLGVMLTATFVFLVCLVYFPFLNYWVVYPAGVFCIYITDAILAQKTHQRLRIINYLVYVPAAMPMLYLVLGGLHIIPWSPGWLLMPLSVVIDLVIALGAYINHRKYVYKPEKEEDEA